MRHRLSTLILVAVPLVSGIAHAECLPTLESPIGDQETPRL
jgi:hypothetical protein